MAAPPGEPASRRADIASGREAAKRRLRSCQGDRVSQKWAFQSRKRGRDARKPIISPTIRNHPVGRLVLCGCGESLFCPTAGGDPGWETMHVPRKVRDARAVSGGGGRDARQHRLPGGGAGHGGRGRHGGGRLFLLQRPILPRLPNQAARRRRGHAHRAEGIADADRQGRPRRGQGIF